MKTIQASDSIFEKDVNPLHQAGVALFFCLLFNLIWWGTRASGLMEFKQNFPWQNILSFLLLYAVANSILSFPAKEVMKYYSGSIFGFMALASLGGGMAYLFSGLSMEEAGSIKWVYFVFTFGYLVFISIVQMMRKIIEMAQRQDKKLSGDE